MESCSGIGRKVSSRVVTSVNALLCLVDCANCVALRVFFEELRIRGSCSRIGRKVSPNIVTSNNALFRVVDFANYVASWILPRSRG